MVTRSDSPTNASGADDPYPSVEPATLQPPRRARERHLLEQVAAELAASGVAGETRTLQLLYLVVTSRLLERPCSAVVKGPSAAGKSFVVEQILGLFPPGAYYALSAMSERALVYDREPLAHRMLVLYKAVGISGDFATYLVRSLLSEGHIDYVTVVRGKAGFEHRHIIREGPTGLITTTTAVSLHPENETRLLSLTVTDSPTQTRAIMLAYAAGGRAERDRREWHDFQSWLAESAVGVVVPYAGTLADAIPPVAVRLRRDFPTLITLIRAHALLHQVHRRRDTGGRVVANFEDYATVRGLLADLFADAAERSVPMTMRETVRALEGLAASEDPLGEGLTVTRVAAVLGLDKASALRRVRHAIDKGFLKNLEEHRGRPARLVSGEPMPDDAALLPTIAELERLHGCIPIDGDTENVELDYPGSAWNELGIDAGDVQAELLTDAADAGTSS